MPFLRKRSASQPETPEDILRATQDIAPDQPRTGTQRLMQGLTVLGIGIASCAFVVALIIGIQKQEAALALLKQLWQSSVGVVIPNVPNAPGMTPKPILVPAPVTGPSDHPRPTPVNTPQGTQESSSRTPQPSLPPVPSNALPSEAPVMVSVPAGFFGDDATLTRFEVTGTTPEAIRASILEYGVPLYAGKDAVSWVRPVLQPWIRDPFAGAGCTVKLNGPSAVEMRYEVYLPTWDPRGADSATVQWWNDTLTEAMLHEHNHIDVYDSYVGQINSAVQAGDDCDAAHAKYDRLLSDMNERQCEFDMASYGLAPGESLDDCRGFRG